MKNAFWFGLGLGLAAGAYFYKNCPPASKVYDSAESNVKDKLEECQQGLARRRKNKSEDSE